MSTIGWIIVVIIWIAIAFWPARVAGRKGHSFIGYFVFSLVFFPLALLMAYMVPDRSRAQERLSPRGLFSFAPTVCLTARADVGSAAFPNQVVQSRRIDDATRKR